MAESQPTAAPTAAPTLDEPALERMRHDLQAGLKLFQADDPEAASARLNAVLRVWPEQSDALHLLGLIAHRRGQHGEAVAQMQRAIATSPDNPSYYCHLAGAYQAAGKVDEALANYRRAIELKPDFAAAHFNLGNFQRERGAPAEAIDSYRRAIAANADFAEAQVNLALALLDTGAAAEAEAAAKEAVARAPQIALAHGTLGSILLALGDAAGAAEACRQAIALAPEFAPPQQTLGDALFAQGNAPAARDILRTAAALEPKNAATRNSLGAAFLACGAVGEAESCFRLALTLEPEFAIAHSNLGKLLREQGNDADAATHCLKAVELEPGRAQSWNNLSVTLISQNRLPEAGKAAVRATKLAPDLAEAHNNLGTVLDALGRHDEALPCFERAVALEPDYAEAHFNRALAWLTAGDYARGWPEYEWRLKLNAGATARVPGPAWKGEPLDGKTILLLAEQGLGDTIQFVRFVPALAARGARVVLACPAPLGPLLEGAPGISQIIAGRGKAPAFDFHAALPSLPHRLGVTLDTLPAAAPYLPKPAMPMALKAPDGARLKVGIAWAGSPANKINRRRSCPIQRLEPLLALPDIAFYSLQVGRNAADLKRHAAGQRVQDLSPRLGDFAAAAAAMAALDLIVTIDTAMAHLAGALARPVWVMLSRGGDWRYLREREDSPWYPTMRLFRQPAPGDWAAVVARVADELSRFAPGAG